MSFTPWGTRTRIVYGPASDGWPTMIARRTDGGNAGKGFHSRSSDSADLKRPWPGWWGRTVLVSLTAASSSADIPNPPLNLPERRVIAITADSTVLVIRHLTPDTLSTRSRSLSPPANRGQRLRADSESHRDRGDGGHRVETGRRCRRAAEERRRSSGWAKLPADPRSSPNARRTRCSAPSASGCTTYAGHPA